MPRTWIEVGFALTALVTLFLTFDVVLKVLELAPAIQATTELGYPASTVRVIGIIELVCLALYLLPRTTVFGAVLMTGYLGGAIATHVRVGSPLLTHTLFPIFIALLLWEDVIPGVSTPLLGTLALWVAAILTLWSMFHYLKLAAPYLHGRKE